MVTRIKLTQLQARHTKRFAGMEKKAASMMKGEVAQDLTIATINLHSAAGSGSGRPAALAAADHPFATRHGVPLWPTPPIGYQTHDLIDSLHFPFEGTPGTYAVVAKSVGTDYAKFLYSENGTSKMLPRGLIQAEHAFAVVRMQMAGRNLLDFQRSLL